MERRGDEIHIDSDEARAGSTNNVVRWILIAGLLLVITAFTIIVMIGSASQSDQEDDVTLKVDAQDQSRAGGENIDGIVSEGADELPEPATDADREGEGRIAN
jgi:hypothetical protein